MSSENKTPNIRLNQWQGHEYVRREDFVNDNLIIDSEIKDLQDEKVDKVPGKGLSTNDYTDEEKNKLTALEEEIKTPTYTPPIHNYSNIFSVGKGYADDRSALDYSESVVDGQVSVGLNGITWENKLGIANIDSSVTATTDADIITINDDGTIGRGWIKKINLKVNHKYFAKFKIKNTSEVNMTTFRIGDYWVNNTPSKELYGTIIPNSDSTANYFRAYSVGTGQIYFDYAFVYDLTSIGLDWMTKEQANAYFHYVSNTKSTVLSLRGKSTGKNLTKNGNGEEGIFSWQQNSGATLKIENGLFKTETTSSAKAQYQTIKVKPNTEYTLSAITQAGTSIPYLRTYEKGTNNIIASTSSTVTFNTGDRTEIDISMSQGGIGYCYFSEIQLEEGDTATPYEPYKEDKTYISCTNNDRDIEELRSLPNGVKDEVSDGKLYKRTDKYKLSDSNFFKYNTSKTSFDCIQYYEPADYINAGNYSDSNGSISCLFKEQLGVAWWSNDVFSGSDIVFNISVSGTTISFIFPKNTFTSEADAKAYFNGTTLTYQLAEPKITELQNIQSLYAYKNGTIQFENVISKTSIYNDAEGCIITQRNYPIKTIDFIKKVNKQTGQEIRLDVSKVEFVLEDGKKIGFIHPDLSDNDLVDWDYYYENKSTNAEKVISYPINTKAQIDGNTKSATANSRSIEDLNGKMSNVITDLNSQKLPSIEGQASIIDMPIGTKYGGFNELIVDGQSLVNSVVNGDFSTGTTKWGSYASTITVTNNILTNTGNGTYRSITVYQYVSKKPNNGEKMFIFAKVRVTNTECTELVSQVAGSSGAVNFDSPINNPIQNQWYEVYGITDNYTALNGDNIRIYLKCYYSDTSMANGKTMEVDGNAGVFAITMTQLGIEDYTEEQMLNLVRNGYFEGMQSVVNPTFKTEGVNLFNRDKFINESTSSALLSPYGNGFKIKAPSEGTYRNANMGFDLKPNTDYRYSGKVTKISGTSGGKLVVTNGAGTKMIGHTSYYPIHQVQFKTDSIGKVRVYAYATANVSEWGEANYTDMQLEEGTQIIPYKPYSSSQASIKMADGTDCIARSLPNGVRDEVNILSQKMVRNVSNEYTLIASDIVGLITSSTNVDLVILSKSPSLSGYIDFDIDNKNATNIQFEKFSPLRYGTVDDVNSVGKYYKNLSNWGLIVPKGKYANLSEAQADLAGTKLQYQLATPTIENIQVSGNLTSFTGGRMLQWNGYNQAHTADASGVITLNYAVKEVDEIFYFDSEGDKAIKTSYSLSSDGLSITGLTANTSYHVEGKAKNQVMAKISGKTVGNKNTQIDSNTETNKIQGKQIADMQDTIAMFIVKNA